MMGECYGPGFAPALTFLRSQVLCRLYKRPSDETIKLEEEKGTPTSIPPFPPFSPSLISRTVSVDVKHHVYFRYQL